MNTDTETTRLIVADAERRGWKVERFGRYLLISDNTGRSRLFKESAPPGNSSVGTRVASNKADTAVYLTKIGYTLPPSIEYTDESSANVFLRQNGPIVVKPARGEQGKGVQVNVQTEEQLRIAVRGALPYKRDGGILLQAQLSGREYRLLMLGGQLFAAAYRKPASVIGDGHNSIRQLVGNENDRRRQHVSLHLEEVQMRLLENHAEIDPDGVPKNGEVVTFPWLASMSLGGETEDVTELVHPDYVAMAQAITSGLGLDLCGFDIITDDISQPMPQVLPLIEINSMPGFKPHMYPAAGKPRNPAPALLDFVFAAKAKLGEQRASLNP